MRDNAKALLALTGASTIWGLNAYANTLMLPHATPFTLTAIRFLLSSSVLFLYFILTKQFRLPSLKILFYLYILGVIFSCGNSLLVLLGLQYSTVSHSSLINATSPLFIAIFSYFIFKTHLLNIQWIGIFLALYGTIYILTNGNFTSIFSMQFNTGDLFFFGAQLGWTTYSIFSPRVLKHVSVLELVCWTSFFGGLTILAIDLITGSFTVPALHPNVFIGLFYTGIMTSLIAMVLWNYGVKFIGPSIGGVFVNLSTVIGITSGVFLLGDPFSYRQLFGIIAVFTGIFLLVQYRLVAKFFKFIDDMYSITYIQTVVDEVNERENTDESNEESDINEATAKTTITTEETK